MRFIKLYAVVASVVMFGLLFVGCGNNTKFKKADVVTDFGDASIEAATLGNTRNVYKIGDVYFAGQPDKADLEKIKNVGVNTVINLRMPDEVSWDEKQAVNELGMIYYNLPLGSADMMTPELSETLRGLLNNVDNLPLLLHCGSANRVGAMWLIYRVIDDGLSYEEALAEAKTVGLRSDALTNKAKELVELHQK